MRLLCAGLGPNQIANHMGWSLRYTVAVTEDHFAVRLLKAQAFKTYCCAEITEEM